MADSVFGRALGRGVDQTQMLGYWFAQALGEASGFDALEAWGEEGVLRNIEQIAANPPEITSLDDIKSFSDAGDWFLEVLGENAITLLTVLATAGAGTFAAAGTGAGKTLAKATLGKALKQQLPKQAFDELVKRRAVAIGSRAGAGAASFVLNTGEAQATLKEHGIDDPGDAFVAGSVKAALDVVGLDRIMSAARGIGVPPESLLQLGLAVAKKAGETGLVEGVTESLQTVVDLAAVKANDPSFDMFSEDTIPQILNAFAEGAVVGGVAGGAANSVVQVKAYDRARRKAALEMDGLEEEVELENLPNPVVDAIVAQRRRDWAEGEDDREQQVQPPASDPILESVEQINAQIRAMRDPTSTKRAVLVDAGTPMGELDITDADQVFSFIAPSGRRRTLITSDTDIARSARATARMQGTISDQDIGGVLFPGMTSPQPVETDRVVVARDRRGVPVAEIAADRATQQEAVQAAQGVAPIGGSVAVQTPEQTLDERMGVAGATALIQKMPLAYQREVYNRLKGPERTVTLDSLMQLTRLSEPEQNDFIAQMHAVNTAEIEQAETEFRNRIQREEDISGAISEAELAQQEGVNVPEEQGLFNPEGFAENQQRRQVLARDGYAKRESALNQARKYAEENPDPNRGEMIVEELDNNRFGVFEQSVEPALQPEQTVEVPGGRQLSETQYVTAIAARAKQQGKQRHNLVTRKENQRKRDEIERVAGREALRDAEDSYITVLDPKGREVRMTTMDLTQGGMNLLEARGVARETTDRDFQLQGFTTMVNELSARGYDMSSVLKEVPRGTYTNRPVAVTEIRDDLLLTHGAFDSADYTQQPRVGAAGVKRQQGQLNPTTAKAVELDEETGTTEFVTDPALAAQQPAMLDPNSTIQQRRQAMRDAQVSEPIAIVEDETGQVQAIKKEEKEQARRGAVAGREADKLTLRQKQARRRTQAVSARFSELQSGNIQGYGKSLEGRDVQFLDSIARELGIDVPIKLVGLDAINTKIVENAIDPKAMKTAKAFFKDNPGAAGFVVYSPTGPVIFVKPFPNTSEGRAQRTLTIGHEFGHVVLRAAWKNISPANRDRLKKLFAADRKNIAIQDWKEAGGQFEWFADKVAARAASLASKPENVIDKIFRDTAMALRKLWNEMKGRIPKRFHRNKSFEEVLDQMKREGMLDSSAILAVRPDTVDAMAPSVTIGERVSRADLKGVRDFLQRFLNRASTTPAARALFTLDQRIRALAGDKVADKVYQQSNTTTESPAYHNSVSAARRAWSSQLINLLKPYVGNEQAVKHAFDQLAQELPNSELSPLAVEIRQFLNDYHTQYLAPNLPWLTKVADYFPRNWNFATVWARSEDFVDLLVEFGMDRDNAHTVTLGMKEYMKSSEPTADANSRLYQRWMLKRAFVEQRHGGEMMDGFIKKAQEEGFLNEDPLNGIWSYLADTTRTVEWERRFGGTDPETGEYSSVYELDQMLEREVPEDKRAEVRGYIVGSVFPQTLDPTNTFHEVLGEIKAYESFRVLAMSGVASIPELGGVFIRNKGNLSLKEMRDTIRATVTNYKEAQEMAEQLGVINPFVGAAIGTEIYQDPSTGQRGIMRKFLPQFFKYNMNDAVVNMTRTIGVAMGKAFILKSAQEAVNNNSARHKRYLRELGVQDPQQILDWYEDGAPAWSSHLRGAERKNATVALTALSKFVDESSVNPNASERPSYAQHPIGGMIFHLKTFATSFNKNIIEGIYRELGHRLDEEGLRGAAPFIAHMVGAMFAMIFLGAASDELRHRLLSLGQEGTIQGQRRDFGDTVAKWVDRAGFTSLPYIDVLHDPIDPETYAYAMGPTTHHLYEFMAENYGPDNLMIKILKAIPGLSQSPDIRREIREITNEHGL